MTFGQHSNIVKSNVGLVKSNVKCYEVFYNTADWNNYSYKVLASSFAPMLSRNNFVCTKLKLGSSGQPTEETSLLEFICVKNTF